MSKASVVVAIFMVMATSAFAGEAEERDALAKLLPGFVSAWNKGDVSALMMYFHADCPIRKAYDTGEAGKKKVQQGLKELFNAFGDAKSPEVRKYLAQKGRFVVRITYSKKGMVPGTIAVKTGKAGRWLISDFNIDGQGEPELKD